MGTAFEIGLILSLQPELTGEDRETLAYMTRSEDYGFQTRLDDPFFTEYEQGFDKEWRIIIANNHIRSGEECTSQIRRSIFCSYQLCFRILIDENTYYNIWPTFSDWLFSISNGEGLAGYILNVSYMEAELIFLEENGLTLQAVENCRIPKSLLHSIDELLGGTRCVDL
ncbi:MULTISPECIES: hypothetical protein [unclassified Leptolyngbya]|uniref:hypothetical protein n=1 Tax=unclassified Leptolyngbya TaxID=2650499 RepID=UPI001689857C|nr:MULTISPECIES: hypothetical protein [unclassified Leptolyngbya]MBD1910263.1 hypothetical protein [Leptolyngbya sp. FACHB-8]MBD2156414.1 hypothetical protein [Leptolyngbya sp. FACHB-16]